MTVSTYTTNLADIYAGAGKTTDWSALGGGPAGLNTETDYFIQGTGCTSKNAFASARRGMILDGDGAAGDQGGTPTDGAYMMWLTQLTPNSLDIIANGGITMLIGSSNSDYVHYYVGGSDTIEFGGWIIAAVKEQTAGDEADAGSPSSTVESHFGALFDLPSGGPAKGAPQAIDAIRFGRCDLIYELGTGGDPDASFDLAVVDKGDVTDRLGLIQKRAGVFYMSGLHQLGDNSSDAVNFTDSNKTLLWNDHPHVTALFNAVLIEDGSAAVSTVDMTNISWGALGTQAPGVWNTDQTDDPTVNLITCTFTGWGSFEFASNTIADRCTFLQCGPITANEADLSGSSFLLSSAAADDAAVLWDETISGAHVIAELEDTTFEKGAAAHHAITFGTGITDGADITLTGIEFTGFNTASGDANDSTVEFLASSGDITLNLVGCTVNGAAASASNFTVDDAAGVTVTVVYDPETTKITVEEADGTLIQNARVLLETGDNGGGSGLPYQAGVTTLTQAAGVATLTASAVHGLATGDVVVVRGANIEGYNKQATITVTSTTVFTYSVDSGLGSPAGGTPVFSYAPISGLTDVNGEIQTSKTWPASQSLIGWARKSTAAPFFRQTAVSVADASGGTDLLLALQPDD